MRYKRRRKLFENLLAGEDGQAPKGWDHCREMLEMGRDGDYHK